MNRPKIPVRLNPNVRGLSVSATLAINERSNELIASGKKVYKYGLGQSPFPVPKSIVRALQEHAHEKDYLPVRGLRPLRDAIAGYHRRVNHLDGSGDDVLIGPGSKELLFLLQFVYAGDLLIPEPSWVSYEPQARILGSRVHWLSTNPEERWIVRPDVIEDVCTNNPDRPRILILNYPSNPTGQTFSEKDLAAIAEICRERKILILSDEIYGELTFDGSHRSIVQHYPEGTIVSGGLSKWAGAGGWRLGYFVFPRQLRWLLDAMAVVASETYTSVSAPIQYAAIQAFSGGVDLSEYLTKSRGILSHLGQAIAHKLQAAGIQVHDPQGAFYLFPDFSQFEDQFNQRGIRTTEQMCEALLEEAGVAILPGSAFGRPSAEFTARLAYVNFDGEAALNAEEPVDRAFIDKYCAQPLAAADAICDWVNNLR